MLTNIQCYKFQVLNAIILLQVLPMVTATSILSGDLRNAVKTAQRQVHYYPNDKNAYQILRVAVNAL